MTPWTVAHQAPLSPGKNSGVLSKSLQTINAGDGVEKRDPSYTVGGNATIIVTMENSVEFP